MAPKNRLEELSTFNITPPLARKSAVLILLFPDHGKLKTVLIKRSEYDGVHSGQVSFPGGKFENTDSNFEATALRETNEEIGVDPVNIEIIGQLTDFYIPPSNFLVKVFVGYTTNKPEYIPDSKEVQSVVEVDLDEFYHAGNISEKEFFSTSRREKIIAPCYSIKGLEIWGATAMMLSELLDVFNQPANSSNHSNFSNSSNSSNSSNKTQHDRKDQTE